MSPTAPHIAAAIVAASSAVATTYRAMCDASRAVGARSAPDTRATFRAAALAYSDAVTAWGRANAQAWEPAPCRALARLSDVAPSASR